MFVHQCQQVSLRHEGIAQVQFVEFRLAWTIVFNIICFTLVLFHPGYKEIVQWSVLHELERAKRMCDAFEIVALAVREVVHGIGIPFVARLNVRNVHHSIEQWVAEEHVGMTHVYLCAQNQSSWSCFPTVHELKQAQVLFYGAIAEWAVGAW